MAGEDHQTGAAAEGGGGRALTLEAQLKRVSGRSPIAEAMRYGLSRWNGLGRFLDDGRIEIDTNVVERSIRPIALNRKNALFAGSDEGGANWAIIASLIETALCRPPNYAERLRVDALFPRCSRPPRRSGRLWTRHSSVAQSASRKASRRSFGW